MGTPDPSWTNETLTQESGWQLRDSLSVLAGGRNRWETDFIAPHSHVLPYVLRSEKAIQSTNRNKLFLWLDLGKPGSPEYTWAEASQIPIQLQTSTFSLGLTFSI